MDNAFHADIPPVGMNKPVEAPNLVVSTNQINLRNGNVGTHNIFGAVHRSEGNNDSMAPRPNAGGRITQDKVIHSAEHRIFDDTGVTFEH